MIVIGSDPHKSNHAFAGLERALAWGRALGAPRVWAIEDCRHVSGRLERLLVARGERVVRVAPKLMAAARRGARTRGKSDPIDALAVARAALRERVETLPAAFLDERALEIKLLLDHHDDLVSARTADQGRLRWHLHDLECPVEVPSGGLDRAKWLERVGRWLAGRPQRARVRVARRLVVQVRAQTREVRALARELAGLVAEYRPELLELAGCGPLSAAKLIAETAGAERFKTDAQFARTAGVAPIPASSGRTDRHRLDRGGNRQLNCALHRIAVTAGRTDPQTAAYLARNKPKERPEWKRCAASNATSPAASGTPSPNQPRPRTPLTRRTP